MLVHAIIWNAVHPPMHGLPPVHLGAGFGTVFPGGATFSEWILESAYGRYIDENHMGQHVLGPVIAPQTHGGVPQLPTREEYFAAKNRAAAVAAEQGTAPAVLANGGSMIADAYST